MMMTLIKISKKDPVSCKIRIILMMKRMRMAKMIRMAKMMRMTRVVSEIFTQGSFTRPLQKLLPTGLAAYTGLRLRVLMMMIIIDIDVINNSGDDYDDEDDNEYGRLYS